MRSSNVRWAIGAVALAAVATTMPAEARNFRSGLAGGLVAGAIIGGAASSAYAYAPGPGYGYEGYDGYDGYGVSPGYGVRRSGTPYRTFGVYDESQHGGQPSYTQPLR